MLSPAAISAYAGRTYDLFSVASRQLGRALYRRIRRRPVEGPDLLREGFEQLSGSFLKLGQILSLQVETLPREYCNALLRLLDRVPPIPEEHIDGILREELSSPAPGLFREFDYQPVASASIGQVHRAVAKDGRPIAVKIQRPGIRRQFERDVLLMQAMVRLIFAFRLRRLYFMRDPVRELVNWTRDELDYRREAAYCDLLGGHAAGNASERVPAVHWDLTTARVLTMDYLEGPSVSEYIRMLESNDERRLAALQKQGFNPAVFSNNVIQNFLRDAFRNGVFHADLHPANLLILPNNVVGYVDFGIVAVLTPEARRKQIELTLAFAVGDAEAIYQAFMNICMVDEHTNRPLIRRQINDLARQWYREPAVGGRVRLRVSVTTAMMDLLTVCQTAGVLVDREMIKYIRSTILADGLVTRLAPGFDLAQSLREVVEEYLAAEGVQQVFSKQAALRILTDMTLWMQAGPSAFLRAMNLFERGRLNVSTTLEIEPSRDAPQRARAIATAAVWASLLLVLGFTGRVDQLRAAPLFATILGIFVALLTVRVVRLLLRLRTR